MAVRNPTNYASSASDEHSLRAGRKILTTVPSQIADDQVFVLDQAELIMSDCFSPILIVAPFLRVFVLESKDMCGLTITNNEIQHTFYALARAVDAPSGGTIQLQSTAVVNNTRTLTVPVGATGWVWYSGTLNVKTNAIEDTLTLACAGTTNGIYLAGLGLIADET